MMSRKKRRGIIEKRRRDRINSSLLELRRLVPTAFEKQGSAKLEKAEILQMTVDHLKNLQAKGDNSGNGYDATKLAMDYHSIGFRECAAEVARYLVSVEGLDLQDPLRLRLMSHLQCFAAQRDPKYQSPQYSGYDYQPGNETPSSINTSSNTPSSGNNSANSSFESGASSSTGTPCEAQQPPTLTPLTPVSSYNQPYPHSHYGVQASNHHQQGYHSPVSSQKQPYRPWGAELAY